jgi:3-hydroxymyristoyl/3-hydroxydecanoyl-(acyl carrier protein) dehydratase
MSRVGPTTSEMEILTTPAAQLTAHQAPALLIARVKELLPEGGEVVAEAHQGLDALQLLEACAQAVAVLTGARMRASGDGQPASGMLVGAKSFQVARSARPGETVRIRSTMTHALGPLQLHQVVAYGEEVGTTAGVCELAQGELKVVRTEAS